jgi:hypothetical protein
VEHRSPSPARVVKGDFGDFDTATSDLHRQHPDVWANVARPADAGDHHAEELFRELDGRRIAQASGVWLIIVSAIHTVGAQRWIQVALSGAPSYSLIVKASDRIDGPTALDAIGAWLTSPFQRDRVITVD